MWEERDSETFLEFGGAFVPDRARQMGIICDLLPACARVGTIVELCCGEGLLARELMRRYPECRVVGFDRSGVMRGQFECREFELRDAGWRVFQEKVGAVVSSLALHHLYGEEKRQLFRDMHGVISPGGAMVVADLVLPASPEALAVAAREWDGAIAAGDWEAFERERWNLFRYPDEETDHPSGLQQQLEWMREAGFVRLDVSYLRAGHAIFSGTVE